MKREMLRKVMKRAHEIARKLVGDYVARLKMALKIAWKEVKKVVNELAELVGTPKQVAWANDIRKKAIENIERFIEKEEYWIKNSNYEDGKKEAAENVAKLRAFLDKVKSETNAVWFINNRTKFDWQYEVYYMAGIEEN